jgi:hypothetical protein
MSNPDERTAIDQFGSGDKYFGVSMLLATLPGLPMFGHGQIEGFTERYGMDFKQARLDEYPNEDLVTRHQHLIAPLLRCRYLFADSEHFLLYDFWNDHGTVDENVFAYSNRQGNERAVIIYNNSYQSTHGTIHFSVGFLEKATGSMQQESLARGLNLTNDDSIVVAYADNVLGLEYLRRTSDLRDHGLTLGLRGYQHVALLKWRELQSTAGQPWDRLCDALHGSGVYSIEEALSKLQIRPLLEALRQAVSATNIDVFMELSHELAVPAGKIADKSTRDFISETKQEIPEVSGATKAVRNHMPTVDSRLKDFIDHAYHFKDRVKELSELDGATLSNHPQKLETTPKAETSDSEAETDADKHGLFARWSGATLHLPILVSAFPESLQVGASVVLPNPDPKISPIQTWAPVLAWLAFQILPPRFDPFGVFEKFNLRWALAETFSSVGLEGEAAWKAAAQVSVLLKFTGPKHSRQIVRTEEFWKDADVRWLAGVNTSAGVEYMNQERFEELLCWFELPTLLGIAASEPCSLEDVARATSLPNYLTTLLQGAGFEYQRFLELLLLGSRTSME